MHSCFNRRSPDEGELIEVKEMLKNKDHINDNQSLYGFSPECARLSDRASMGTESAECGLDKLD